MDRTLVGYVRALRAAGADASIAESIDAARAVAVVGYQDRQALKDALGVVLAKSEPEKAIHHRLFDQYFGLPDLPPPPPDQANAADRAAASDPSSPADAGQGADATPSPADAASAIGQLLALAAGGDGPGQATPLAAALARAAQAAGVDEIRFQTQIGVFTRRLLDQLGTAPLDERLRALLLDPATAGSAEVQAELHQLQAARERLRRAARAVVEQRFELYGRPATEAFMQDVVTHRALGRLSPPDMERMKRVVARMAKRLAVRHSRRRRIKLQGQLDFRRTLRSGAGQDSVPFKLHFKHRRRDKPRFVAICDVSGSVAAHVRFLLLFLYALHGTVADLRSFAFSNQLKDVGPMLENLPFDEAFAQVLREAGGGSTDYGQALVDLQDEHWDCIDRRTTVLILGDGRSNNADPRLDILAELADRAKRVLWLCPEPRGRWGSGDSCMLQYQPFCTQVSHCASAADLERAIDEALAAY